MARELEWKRVHSVATGERESDFVKRRFCSGTPKLTLLLMLSFSAATLRIRKQIILIQAPGG